MTRSGQAAKTRATSTDVAPCAPTPGARKRPRASKRLSGGSMWLGLTTAPMGPITPRPNLAFSSPMSTSNSSSTLRPDWLIADWTLPAAGVEGASHHQQAAPSLVGASNKGAHGGHAQIGVDRQCVGSERGIGSEEHFGIALLVVPTSPRLASTITSSPALRASAIKRCSVRNPCHPCRS